MTKLASAEHGPCLRNLLVSIEHTTTWVATPLRPYCSPNWAGRRFSERWLCRRAGLLWRFGNWLVIKVNFLLGSRALPFYPATFAHMPPVAHFPHTRWVIAPVMSFLGHRRDAVKDGVLGVCWLLLIRSLDFGRRLSCSPGKGGTVIR